jgi:hypothetical protein
VVPAGTYMRTHASNLLLLHDNGHLSVHEQGPHHLTSAEAM